MTKAKEAPSPAWREKPATSYAEAKAQVTSLLAVADCSDDAGRTLEALWIRGAAHTIETLAGKLVTSEKALAELRLKAESGES